MWESLGTGSGEVDGFLLSSCLMMESLEDGTCFFILVIICLNFVLCFFFLRQSFMEPLSSLITTLKSMLKSFFYF